MLRCKVGTFLLVLPSSSLILLRYVFAHNENMRRLFYDSKYWIVGDRRWGGGCCFKDSVPANSLAYSCDCMQKKAGGPMVHEMFHAYFGKIRSFEDMAHFGWLEVPEFQVRPEDVTTSEKFEEPFAVKRFNNKLYEYVYNSWRLDVYNGRARDVKAMYVRKGYYFRFSQTASNPAGFLGRSLEMTVFSITLH